ncbi:hypothetical protein LL033_17765 [Clostridium estertheticum]|uniref:hypothetical protein n=1 Tax=Clostridium estertheticum TaxID=238834 RepID=UPI001C0E36A6|nr:hypothetical protein [Clostridium estertheticum]MBU3216516.1 hypothetical protein [Clostridium estertheticum]WAG54460.1 hypothetical protein LL033_17765 [Clostridium estertheticum]
MNLSYEPSRVKAEDIKKAVDKTIEEENKVDTDKDKKEKEMKLMWTKFIISAIFTVPLLYISMGKMIGYPIPGDGIEVTMGNKDILLRNRKLNK